MKLTIPSIFFTQDSEFRSFFGRIEKTIIFFRDCLIFRGQGRNPLKNSLVFWQIIRHQEVLLKLTDFIQQPSPPTSPTYILLYVLQRAHTSKGQSNLEGHQVGEDGILEYLISKHVRLFFFQKMSCLCGLIRYCLFIKSSCQENFQPQKKR